MTQAANLAALGTNAGTTGILPIAGGGTAGTGGAIGFKNRLINGNMTIDQRNAGASVTVNGNAPYTLDRWRAQDVTDGVFTVQQDAGAVTPPAGFIDYLGVTTTTADSSLAANQVARIFQPIEGFNIADLGWGTANAKTVTLSFWVRSSLTGSFGGSLLNGADNRAYPFSYTINSANTWEFETITIPGDTSGTWATNNTTGMYLIFGLGIGSSYSGTAGAWASGELYAPTGSVSVIGTNGATWYMTGCQLEVGTAATNFDVRPYTTELQLCQRYLNQYVIVATTMQAMIVGSFNTTTVYSSTPLFFPVTMRTQPTITYTGTTFLNDGIGNSISSTIDAWNSFVWGTTPNTITASGLTTGKYYFLSLGGAGNYFRASAEL